MMYTCVCGHTSHGSFNSFQQGHRCKKCGYKKSSDSLRMSQEEVENIFKIGNCKLLDIYENSSIPVKYQCECGNISTISLGNFQSGARCQKCKIKNTSGEKHHNYR